MTDHHTVSFSRFKRRKLLTPPESIPIQQYQADDLVQQDQKMILIQQQKQQQKQENKQQEDDKPEMTAVAAADALIPGLPDHIAQICLATIHPSTLYSVSRSWRRLLSSPSFPPYLSVYALLSKRVPVAADELNVLNRPPPESKPVNFFSFDPIRSTWTQLPPPPPSVKFTDQHRSFLSLNLPIQSVSVGDHLVVVAATDPLLHPALDAPLIFDPIQKSWSYGPELSSPRRWCAAGSSSGAVYVASGVGSQFKSSVARSVEKWRFGEAGKKNRSRGSSKWEKMKSVKDGRLSREAIEAVGCRGKLYMVNVKGNALKEGFVYDTKSDLWEEMKEGMLAGWKGPAAAMDEEDMYVVDERRGVLLRYDWAMDAWVEVVQLERLRGAEQMAARGGKVVVVGGVGEIVVVDVSDSGRGRRSWVVEPPVGFRVSSVYVLPRM